jgi:hypothetical protein
MEDLKNVCDMYEEDDWGYCNWLINCEVMTCKNNCYLDYDKNIKNNK